ncbi:MAG: hypothetical protein ACSLFN_00465 [Candidatus Limnocylindrales bacterium]
MNRYKISQQHFNTDEADDFNIPDREHTIDSDSFAVWASWDRNELLDELPVDVLGLELVGSAKATGDGPAQQAAVYRRRDQSCLVVGLEKFDCGRQLRCAVGRDSREAAVMLGKLTTWWAYCGMTIIYDGVSTVADDDAPISIHSRRGRLKVAA